MRISDKIFPIAAIQIMNEEVINEEYFLAIIELKSILSIRSVLGYELFLGVYFQFLALVVC